MKIKQRTHAMAQLVRSVQELALTSYPPALLAVRAALAGRTLSPLMRIGQAMAAAGLVDAERLAVTAKLPRDLQQATEGEDALALALGTQVRVFRRVAARYLRGLKLPCHVRLGAALQLLGVGTPPPKAAVAALRENA
jgi:hypothetical protein